MSIVLDKEKQAFLMEIMEIEKEMNQHAQQVRAYETQIFNLRRNVKKNELTLKQLDNIKEDRVMYLPLGKAFIAKKHSQIKKILTDQSKQKEQEAKECQKTRDYYEQKRKEKEAVVKQGIERITKKAQ